MANHKNLPLPRISNTLLLVFSVSVRIMLSGHETADSSSIQIAALIITDHYRDNYYFADFLVKHSTHKTEPFDLKKKGQKRVFL